MKTVDSNTLLLAGHKVRNAKISIFSKNSFSYSISLLISINKRFSTLKLLKKIKSEVKKLFYSV